MKKLLLIAVLAIGSIAAKAQFSPGDVTNLTACSLTVYVYDHPIGDCSWVSGPPPSAPATYTLLLPPGSPTPSWVPLPLPAPGWQRSYYVFDGSCWFGPVSSTSTCPGETNAIGKNSSCPDCIGEIWAIPAPNEHLQIL